MLLSISLSYTIVAYLFLIKASVININRRITFFLLVHINASFKSAYTLKAISDYSTIM